MHEEQLRYFLSAARCGSFSAAARECYVAQPTVSRQIAALEQELGAPLFIRAGRHLTLTATGRYMVEMAQNYLDQCARLQLFERGAVYDIIAAQSGGAAQLCFAG